MPETTTLKEEKNSVLVDTCLQAVDALIQDSDLETAANTLKEMIVRCKKAGISTAIASNTPYINTIPHDKERPYPGDLAIEDKLKDIIRWNAMAMVMPFATDTCCIQVDRTRKIQMQM